MTSVGPKDCLLVCLLRTEIARSFARCGLRIIRSFADCELEVNCIKDRCEYIHCSVQPLVSCLCVCHMLTDHRATYNLSTNARTMTDDESLVHTLTECPPRCKHDCGQWRSTRTLRKQLSRVHRYNRPQRRNVVQSIGNHTGTTSDERRRHRRQ